MIGIQIAIWREAEPMLQALQAIPLVLPRPAFFKRTIPFWLVGRQVFRVAPWLYPHCLPRWRTNEAVILLSGAGPRMGALGARLLIERYGVSGIVNIGTCGALTEGAAVGEIVRIREAFDEQGAVQLENEVPGWEALSTANLITRRNPVFRDAEKRECAKTAPYVDMEGAAIARVCRERSVACTLIKGVSDFADESAKENIVEGMNHTSRRLAEMLQGFLQRL